MIIRKINTQLKTIATFLAFIAAPISYADRVSISDFDRAPLRSITQAEFDAAQRSAGPLGQIRFARGEYLFPAPIRITQDRVRIIGAGMNNTRLVSLVNRNTGKSGAVFNLDADNVVVRDLTLRGRDHIETRYILHEREGSPVRTGTEYGIDIKNNAENLTVRRVYMHRVNVGLGFNQGNLPHGLRLMDSVFSTGRAIIEARDNTRFPATILRRAFTITGNKLIRENGQPVNPNRGLVFDFGNSNVHDPVDLKGSIISNNNIPRLAWWNIGVNRSKNLTISNNILGCGGASPDNRFIHCLHFEDRSSNIVIEDNTMTQVKRNANGEEITLRSHIWTGGNNGAPELTIQNNTFRGHVERSIVGDLPNAIIDDNAFNLNNTPDYVIKNFVRTPILSATGNTFRGAPLRENKIDR